MSGDRSAHLILWERSHLLLGRMRPLFDARQLQPQQVRIAGEVLAILRAAPQSILIAELSLALVEPVTALLGRLLTEFPSARAIIVAQREAAGYELLCRELGAIHFERSPRYLRTVADLAAKHLAAQPQFDEPHEQLGSLWSQLPWGE